MFMYLIYNHYINSTTYQVKHQQCIWAYTHICTMHNHTVYGWSHFLSSCVPEFFGYQGNRRPFWPFLKKIAAKFAVKLELALHSMAPTLPKTPNAKIKLIELFQLKSLNQASKWRELPLLGGLGKKIKQQPRTQAT